MRVPGFTVHRSRDVPGIVYLPSYCEQAGLDPDVLWASALAAQYIPRDDQDALYRGHPLRRSKLYVCDTCAGFWPVYGFPGFQYGAVVNHYQRLHDVQWMQPLFSAVRKTVVEGARITANQAIVTLYENGADQIDWHSDKMASIADPSIIFDVSLGGERTLSLRSKDGEWADEIRMKHGSAVAFTTEFNKAAEHAVLAEPGAGPRASIVFRDIATVKTDEECRRKAKATVRRRAAAR